MTRKSMIGWAKEYCGDPCSHEQRGEAILDLLRRDGLQPTDKVLDVGCGALSQGKPLIEYLNQGRYVGLDPNGWLIEAALAEWPQLLDKNPNFQHEVDFCAQGGPFDYIVAHSVLSHVAHWQMEQALAHLRQLVEEGGRWYASLRLDQYDLFSHQWLYPGVSYFRIETVKVLAYSAGWHVEQLPDWKEELVKVAPNDFHDWIRLTAIPTPATVNEMRLREEKARVRDERILEQAQALYQIEEEKRLAEKMENAS